MALKPLDNLVRIGKLKAESPAREEIEGLLRSGRARLKDSAIDSLSQDSRFDLAYNAAHALSLAALRWHGYRSESRYMVFLCLEHTLKMGPNLWRVLEEAHRKRNIAEYEGELDVDSALVDALIRVTHEIDARLSALPRISG